MTDPANRHFYIKHPLDERYLIFAGEPARFAIAIVYFKVDAEMICDALNHKCVECRTEEENHESFKAACKKIDEEDTQASA